MHGDEQRWVDEAIQACSAVYDRRYGIASIRAVGNLIEVSLEELKGPNGEDETFF